ncbi:MAG: L-arabinose ABC transporter permease AraH, partial [Vibrio casei]
MTTLNPTSTNNESKKTSRFKINNFWDRFGRLTVFAGLFLICAIFVPNFASMINMRGLGLAISMSGMIACA